MNCVKCWQYQVCNFEQNAVLSQALKAEHKQQIHGCERNGWICSIWFKCSKNKGNINKKMAASGSCAI
jgi:hypothetical protein